MGNVKQLISSNLIKFNYFLILFLFLEFKIFLQQKFQSHNMKTMAKDRKVNMQLPMY
jgi:hypothetical protein